MREMKVYVFVLFKKKNLVFVDYYKVEDIQEAKKKKFVTNCWSQDTKKNFIEKINGLFFFCDVKILRNVWNGQFLVKGNKFFFFYWY